MRLRDHGFPLAAAFLWQTQGSNTKRSLDNKLSEFIARHEFVIAEHSE